MKILGYSVLEFQRKRTAVMKYLVALFFGGFSFCSSGQVMESFSNDTLTVSRNDTVQFNGQSLKYVSRKMAGRYSSVSENRYELGIVLAIKKNNEKILLIIKPYSTENAIRFNYYVELFPALKENEIKLRNL